MTNQSSRRRNTDDHWGYIRFPELGTLARRRNRCHEHHGHRAPGIRLLAPSSTLTDRPCLGRTPRTPSATTWIGYRIESNQRWASRSLVLEAADAFDGTDWTEEGLLRVSTMATDGCAQDNGASAERQLLVPGPSFSFDDMSPAEYASALEQLDSAIFRLGALGFSTERTTVGLPSGLSAMAWLTREDETIHIRTAGRRLHISGATNECNSSLILDSMDRPDIVEVAGYSIESVCGAALLELPDRCQEPN